MVIELRRSEIARVLYQAQLGEQSLLVRTRDGVELPARLTRGLGGGLWLKVREAVEIRLGEPCSLLLGPPTARWTIQSAVRALYSADGETTVGLACPEKMVLGDSRSECRIPTAGVRLDALVHAAGPGQSASIVDAGWRGVGARFVRPTFEPLVTGQRVRILLDPRRLALEAAAVVRWVDGPRAGLRLHWPDDQPPEAWKELLHSCALRGLRRWMSASRASR